MHWTCARARDTKTRMAWAFSQEVFGPVGEKSIGTEWQCHVASAGRGVRTKLGGWRLGSGAREGIMEQVATEPGWSPQRRAVSELSPGCLPWECRLASGLSQGCQDGDDPVSQLQERMACPLRQLTQLRPQPLATILHSLCLSLTNHWQPFPLR